MKIISILSVILLFYHVEGLRILGVFPMSARSHYILGSSLMRGLAELGHDVVVISPFGEKTKPKNGTYTDIILTGFLEESEKLKGNLFDMEGMNTLIYQFYMNMMGNMVTELTLNHTNVQKLIHSNEKFDAVIVEQFINDAHKALAYHFKAPLILFSTFGSNTWINPLIGNPAPPSYIAEQAIEFNHKNFWKRLHNTYISVVQQLNQRFFFYPAQAKIAQKYFQNLPSNFDDILYNASLVLLNSHWSTNEAVPRVPNMIDIGGFHVKPPKKLPKDLQEFLDNSPEGVIYFSMGSNLRSADLPPEKRDAILKVFSKLKMKVLWKWEEDSLPGQPPNVKLGKWLPQQDLLAHPNIKLFITHGGLLSLIESVYHGVPVLSIPIFGDQKINAKIAVEGGFGLSISYSDITEKDLADKINDILTNNQYRDNVKRRSAVMHDRRWSPIEEAEYWIRYVVRHKGAPHLRNHGLDLPLYQYLSLDVAAFVIVCSITILYVLSRLVCKRFCSKNTQKVKKN